MTERLKTLLHDESASLEVPPPSTQHVLASGHRLVRRRRAGLAVASVGVAGVLVAGAALGGLLGGSPDAQRRSDGIDPATAAYLAEGAWARGSTIHVGDATATVKGKVKGLYYTSAGVVVRSGNVPWADDAGPSEYGVVGPDGQVRSLGLDLGDRVPGTDPGQPYLAYADAEGSAWLVHVVDVRTGKEASQVAVDGAFTWGGWEAPPVALDGDTVYVGTDGAVQAVDWRTGKVAAPRPWLGRSEMPEVAGGHLVTFQTTSREPAHPGADVQVVDATTGKPLVEQHIDGYGYLTLSPDGRYAKLTIEENPSGEPPSGFDVIEVASGKIQHFDDEPWDFGWTPDGNLVRITKDTKSLCSPTTGTCEVSKVEAGGGVLRIAGNSYES